MKSIGMGSLTSNATKVAKAAAQTNALELERPALGGTCPSIQTSNDDLSVFVFSKIPCTPQRKYKYQSGATPALLFDRIVLVIIHSESGE